MSLHYPFQLRQQSIQQGFRGSRLPFDAVEYITSFLQPEHVRLHLSGLKSVVKTSRRENARFFGHVPAPPRIRIPLGDVTNTNTSRNRSIGNPDPVSYIQDVVVEFPIPVGDGNATELSQGVLQRIVFKSGADARAQAFVQASIPTQNWQLKRKRNGEHLLTHGNGRNASISVRNVNFNAVVSSMVPVRRISPLTRPIREHRSPHRNQSMRF